MRLRNPLTKFKPKIRSGSVLVCKTCGDPYVVGNFDECGECLYPLEVLAADSMRDVLTASLYAMKSPLAYLESQFVYSDPILVCGRPFRILWQLEAQPFQLRWVEDRLNPAPITEESIDKWLQRLWESGR